MRFLGKSLLGLVLLAVSLGFIGAAAAVLSSAFRDRMADKGPGRPVEEKVFAARLMTVEPGRVTPVITAYGEVRALRSLALRAGQPGKVEWVAEAMVDGGEVKAGDVLVRLDDSAARTALAIAQNDLETRQAELAQAEAAVGFASDDLSAAQAQRDLRAEAFARQTDLQSRGVGSPAAVETAALSLSGQDQDVLSRRQALANAEARVSNAKSALQSQILSVEEAKRIAEDLTLMAPFDGRLADVSLTLGGLVSANDSLGQLIDTDSVEVVIRLSTDQVRRLPDPNEAPSPFMVMSDDGALERARGQIVRASASIPEGETGRAVFGQIDGESDLLPGDFVSVIINEPELSDVAVLPAAAIGADGTVLRVANDSRVAAQAVTILRQQGNEVIVAAGDLANLMIVAERSPLLGAGVKVKLPVAEEAAKAEDTTGFVNLTPERRERLIGQVERDKELSPEDKAKIVEQLRADQVPADLVQRLRPPKGG